jgi:lipopolysaccharide cholinephosphotransferase
MGAFFLRLTGLQWVIKGLCLLGNRHYWSYDLTKTWHHHFNDEWIFPLRKLRFEDDDFWAPGDPHAQLSYQYGDYMTPPPEHKRNHHGLGTILVTTPCDWSEALSWERREEYAASASAKNKENA